MNKNEPLITVQFLISAMIKTIPAYEIFSMHYRFFKKVLSKLHQCLVIFVCTIARKNEFRKKSANW